MILAPVTLGADTDQGEVGAAVITLAHDMRKRLELLRRDPNIKDGCVLVAEGKGRTPTLDM